MILLAEGCTCNPLALGVWGNSGSGAGQGAGHSFITSHISSRFSIV